MKPKIEKFIESLEELYFYLVRKPENKAAAADLKGGIETLKELKNEVSDNDDEKIADVYFEIETKLDKKYGIKIDSIPVRNNKKLISFLTHTIEPPSNLEASERPNKKPSSRKS